MAGRQESPNVVRSVNALREVGQRNNYTAVRFDGNLVSREPTSPNPRARMESKVSCQATSPTGLMVTKLHSGSRVPQHKSRSRHRPRRGRPVRRGSRQPCSSAGRYRADAIARWEMTRATFPWYRTETPQRRTARAHRAVGATATPGRRGAPLRGCWQSSNPSETARCTKAAITGHPLLSAGPCFDDQDVVKRQRWASAAGKSNGATDPRLTPGIYRHRFRGEPHIVHGFDGKASGGRLASAPLRGRRSRDTAPGFLAPVRGPLLGTDAAHKREGRRLEAAACYAPMGMPSKAAVGIPGPGRGQRAHPSRDAR